MCANCQPFSYSLFQDISGLGLRHVGYAIPAELFAPLRRLRSGGLQCCD